MGYPFFMRVGGGGTNMYPTYLGECGYLDIHRGNQDCVTLFYLHTSLPLGSLNILENVKTCKNNRD